MMEYPSTFCRETVTVTVDIKQMFQCFLVKEEDRNFLRFLGFQDNGLSKDNDYRMMSSVTVLLQQWISTASNSQFKKENQTTILMSDSLWNMTSMLTMA